VGLANLGSESETCVGSRVRLVGVSISFEKNFYRLSFTPPPLVRRIGPSTLVDLMAYVNKLVDTQDAVMHNFNNEDHDDKGNRSRK
jgi:hypothetical protein